MGPGPACGPSPPRGALLGPRVVHPGILAYHAGYGAGPRGNPGETTVPISRERWDVAAVVFYGDMPRRVVNLVRILEPGSCIVDSIAGEKFMPARALRDRLPPGLEACSQTNKDKGLFPFWLFSLGSNIQRVSNARQTNALGKKVAGTPTITSSSTKPRSRIR